MSCTILGCVQRDSSMLPFIIMYIGYVTPEKNVLFSCVEVYLSIHVYASKSNDFYPVCILASSFDASNQKNYAFKTFSFIGVACGCKYICFNVSCYISYKLIHTDACENPKHFMHYIRIQISTSFVHISHSTPKDWV